MTTSKRIFCRINIDSIPCQPKEMRSNQRMLTSKANTKQLEMLSGRILELVKLPRRQGKAAARPRPCTTRTPSQSLNRCTMTAFWICSNSILWTTGRLDKSHLLSSRGKFNDKLMQLKVLQTHYDRDQDLVHNQGWLFNRTAESGLTTLVARAPLTGRHAALSMMPTFHDYLSR